MFLRILSIPVEYFAARLLVHETVDLMLAAGEKLRSPKIFRIPRVERAVTFPIPVGSLADASNGYPRAFGYVGGYMFKVTF